MKALLQSFGVTFIVVLFLFILIFIRTAGIMLQVLFSQLLLSPLHPPSNPSVIIFLYFFHYSVETWDCPLQLLTYSNTEVVENPEQSLQNGQEKITSIYH